MRLLHTSDWHLGHNLFGRKRTEEFNAFLSWLKNLMNEKGVDVLLVSGDIFDTTTPGNQAQELYYEFLSSVGSQTSCQRVFITAGNHDSASFIEAPKTILKSLKVDVIGAMTENPADEVFEVCDADGKQQLIVCAVPYLREKDLRRAKQGEDVQAREKRTLKAIREHYKAVSDVALKKRATTNVPIIEMGHLYVSGSITKERLMGEPDPVYVGSLGQVPSDIFSPQASYVALGHIHMPQKVGGSEKIQYSGSPLPMSFAEADNLKRVVLLDINEKGEITSQSVDVPMFQELIQIKGDWETIDQQIQALKARDSSAWLEVIYDSAVVMGDLRNRVLELVQGSALEVLRIKNKQVIQEALSHSKTQKELEQLTPQEVFDLCLKENNVAEDQWENLREKYQTILDEVNTVE